MRVLPLLLLGACGGSGPTMQLELDGQSHNLRSAFGAQWVSATGSYTAAYDDSSQVLRATVGGFGGPTYSTVQIEFRDGINDHTAQGTIETIELGSSFRQPYRMTGSFSGETLSGTFDLFAADCTDSDITHGIPMCGGDFDNTRSEVGFLTPQGSPFAEPDAHPVPLFELFWSEGDIRDDGTFPATVSGDAVVFPTGLELPCVTGTPHEGYTTMACGGALGPVEIDGCTYDVFAAVAPIAHIMVSTKLSGSCDASGSRGFYLIESCHANPGSCL